MTGGELLGKLIILSFRDDEDALFSKKIMVKPVLEISRISKRMSNLDMTWECRVDRTDELGVLANSLKTMAKRLDTAMKELESANE